MKMSDSAQHKLSRIRTPRVHITYDVETGGAEEKKELPFLVGVMGDFSGNPKEELPEMKERRFIEIDRDNFNTVLKSCTPRVTMRVDNKLGGEGTDELLNVELNFKNLDDFNPGKIVQQVGPLKKLYEARCRLKDLIAKLDGNEKLNKLLNEVVSDTEKLQEIKKEAFGDNAGEEEE